MYFDKYVNSSCDIIFFKPTSCYSDTGEKSDRHIDFINLIDNSIKANDNTRLRISHTVPWSKMISSSFIMENNILFDEVPASNDVIFSLKTGLKAKDIEVSDSIVYCVTVNEGSITNTVSLKNIESVFDVRLRKNAILKKYGFKPTESVMYQIYKSAHFGFMPCIKLIWRALITGNFFVGYRNWFNTLRKGVKVYRKYQVKE